MKLFPLVNVIYALVVFKIGEKTTKTPSLFTQNLESLSDAQLVDQTLVITNDPAYKNAEFEISQRDWNKQRQSLVGYESDFRKERIIFTRSVDPSILVGNVEVIYDLLAFCYQTALECSTATRNCSSHGSCISKNKCFQCTCNSTVRTDDLGNPRKGYTSPVKWTGESCELQNLSTEFGIQFLTVLIILLALVAGISLLYSLETGNSMSSVEDKVKSE